MFINGLLSMMLATGCGDITRFSGNTTSELGATPNEHLSIAPIQTALAIICLLTECSARSAECQCWAAPRSFRDAIDAAAARIAAAGGKVVNGPMEVPGGSWIVNALDPQGALFALVAPKR